MIGGLRLTACTVLCLMFFDILLSIIHLLLVAVGENNGMLFGRRYFQCREKHGIFVRADKIRFIPSVRW